MLTEDIAAFNELERFIRKTLLGDDKAPGLYQTVRAVPDWAAFQRICGAMQAYEHILAEMRNITRRLNGERVEQQDETRVVN